eukprot:TRINITY_DN1378_c0_g1_i1.p1 TRINITY_DN1378_c0_g1~~TRINITY_DN1378_c0_g1_i1.p1  ORF type:complete len:480 (+),score=186.12 TRINITY_DN1378_c0_g1_i1:197-1636(+)
MSSEVAQTEIDLGGIDFQNLPPVEKSPKSGKDLQFQSKWTIWYDDSHRKGVNSDDWEKNIKALGHFSNIEEFWRYWAVLEDVARLQDGINLRFFKHGIRPSWEDPQNENGGKFVVSAPKNEISRYWSKIVLAAIGEQFKHGDDICGVILSIKPTGAVINIWNKSSEDVGLITTTTAELEEMVGLGMPVRYQPHKRHYGNQPPIPRPQPQRRQPLSHLAQSVASSGIQSGGGPKDLQCIPRHTVDGLAALKSGNLRASMDNARFGRVNPIELEGLPLHKRAELLASVSGDKGRASDLQNARKAFRNSSTDKFPNALLSPIPGGKKAKNPSGLGKSVSLTDSPLPESPHKLLRRRFSDSDEFEENYESSPEVAASPMPILTRLPSADMHHSNPLGGKSDWKRGATTLKTLKAQEEEGEEKEQEAKKSPLVNRLKKAEKKVENSKLVSEVKSVTNNAGTNMNYTVIVAILLLAVILYFLFSK